MKQNSNMGTYATRHLRFFTIIILLALSVLVFEAAAPSAHGANFVSDETERPVPRRLTMNKEWLR